jgi:hypothetical protein
MKNKKIIFVAMVILLTSLTWTTPAITQDSSETSRLMVQVDNGEHRIARRSMVILQSTWGDAFMKASG